jgi:polar amino acid transport system substrate-binding protein
MARATVPFLFLLVSLRALPAGAEPAPEPELRALRWGADATGGGPYVFEGEGGALVGFEVDLAKHLAGKLGLESRYVYGDWGKLPYLLDRGEIDIVLNGYEWSSEREEKWPSTVPYYAYRLSLIARKDDGSIQSFADLRRAPAAGGKKKRVGVLGGSAAERYVAAELGDAVESLPFADVTRTMQLVRDGQLDATLQDLPAAVHYAPDYPELHTAGEPVGHGVYVILCRHEDAPLRTRLNALLAEAMSDGTLERIYRRYGIWTADQAELGGLAEHWPPTAPAAPVATAASSPSKLRRYAETLLRAAMTTVGLACLAMPLAILLGILVATGRLYGPRSVDRLLGLYVEILRGTPVLFQLYVIYYLLPKVGIRIPEFWAGALGLGLNYSAYEAENYRAGILAVPRGQLEAAWSLGMSTRTALSRVILPQAVRIVMPPVTNDFISLFKDSSVCSVIAVTELSNTYNRLSNDHPGAALELGAMTALLYLAMSYPLSLFARRLERKNERRA